MAQRVRWARIREYWPLIAVLAVALATRLFRLTWPGVWSDEGFSIFLARSPLPDLLAGTANDLHPPLFYVLLKVWLLPGLSDLYVRLFPVFWGVLTVALLYHVGRRLFNPLVGTWGALFLALSPTHIAYSREIRMYIVLVFFATLSVYLLWRWVVDPFPGVWIGYIVVTLMALYTQNLALFILPVENVLVVLALAHRRRWRELIPWCMGQIIILLGYIPWLPIAINQTLHHQVTWIGRATLTLLRNSFPHLPFGEPRWGPEGPWQNAAYLWLLVVVLFAGIVYLLRRHSRQPGVPTKNPVTNRAKTQISAPRGARWSGPFAWLWFLLLIGILFGAALLFPIYQEKQFLVLTVPLALLIGVGAAGLPKGGRVAVLLLFLALIVPSLENLYFRHELVDHPPQEAWKELAAYMDAHARPGDAVLLNPGAGHTILDLYLKTPMTHEGYPYLYDPQIGNFAGQIATPVLVESHLRPLAESHRRIWLVECCLPTYWDPYRYLPAWLGQWGRPVEVPHFPGLEVRLFEARGPAEPD